MFKKNTQQHFIFCSSDFKSKLKIDSLEYLSFAVSSIFLIYETDTLPTALRRQRIFLIYKLKSISM